MRRIRGAMFALALGATALAGCSQGSAAIGRVDADPAAIEAQVAKLATEAFKGTGTKAADLESLKALLPKEVDLSWGALTFDAATNATLVTNLKLTPKDMPSMGLQISELRLFDFDAALLKARISGQRLTESAQLARRIDAKGISVFGLADAINMGVSQSMPMPADPATPPAEPASPTKFQPADPTAPAPQDAAPAPEGWPPSTEPEFQMGGMSPPKIDKFDISLGRVIIDDLQVKPWKASPPPPKPAAGGMTEMDEMSAVLPVLQQFVSFMQSYGIDTAAYLDYKIDFAMTEDGQQVAGSALVKSMGARGLRGGDLDGMFIRDVSYSFKAPVPEVAAPIDISASIGLMTMKDLRLEKLLGYIIKGAAPPRTESDLMSLGLWHLENESIKFGGNEIYGVGEGNFDARNFRWFIPTKITSNVKNLTIDLEKLVGFVSQYATPADPSDPTAPNEAAEAQAMLATLQKYGLTKPSFDGNFGWNWNADNGETKLEFGMSGKDLLAVDARYEGSFPSFKAVSDVVPENPETMNPMAVSSVFANNSALKLIDLNIKDNGGLPKIYGLIGEFAPQMGAAEQAMTADQVRDMAVQSVKMLADPQTTGMPALAALMNPVADFLATGGKLHIGVQPEKPMPFMSLVGTMMTASGTPDQAIKQLGLKVDHSK